jgi:hypothetical protein
MNSTIFSKRSDDTIVNVDVQSDRKTKSSSSSSKRSIASASRSDEFGMSYFDSVYFIVVTMSTVRLQNFKSKK